MTPEERLKFDKPVGYHWVRLPKGKGLPGEKEWSLVKVSYEHDSESGRMYKMGSQFGTQTKWTLYYFADAEWGPRVIPPDEPAASDLITMAKALEFVNSLPPTTNLGE